MTILLVAVIISLLLAACSNSAVAQPAPPEIYYGEDVCEFCGMIISEERFAAGYISQDGQQHIFDDIGDMVQSHLENKGEITAAFVHDHKDHTWIKAETAHYVLSDNLPTPMLSGLAAFSTAEKATAFAHNLEGQILTFDELLAYYRENPPTPIFTGSSD
jgi:copper chaperone NosL